MSKYIKRIPRVPAKSYRRFRKTWEDMGVKPIKYFDLSSGDLSWLSQSVSGKLVDKCLDGISDRVDGIDDRTRQRFKEYAGNRSLAEKLINLAKYKEESLKGVDSMAGLMTYLKNQVCYLGSSATWRKASVSTLRSMSALGRTRSSRTPSMEISSPIMMVL